jgi:Flp pilus assembly protein TadG
MSPAPAALHPDRKQHRRGSENARGAVTAEFAVALPAVLLLLALLLSGAAAGVTQLRLEEAAHAGARALARGEDPAAVEVVVRTMAGASAAASVTADGEWLSVTVTDRVGGPMGATVPWTLTARATARSESPAASGTALPGLPFHLMSPARGSPHQVWPARVPPALLPNVVPPGPLAALQAIA